MKSNYILIIVLSGILSACLNQKQDLNYNQGLISVEDSAVQILKAQFGDRLTINRDEDSVHVVTVLFWGADSINELPEEIRSFKYLKELIYTRGKLKVVPEWITEFEELEHLDFQDNELTKFPSFISKIKKLRSVNIGFNPIDKIPEDFFLSSKKLEGLFVEKTNINKFPILFPDSTAIPLKLNLSQTPIDSIPDEVGDMRISILNMNDNHLRYISPRLGEVEELHNITFKGSPNLNGQFPDLGACKNLQTVHLRWCGLTEFPQWITELPNVYSIHLDNNLIKSIPEEIGNCRNLATMRINHNFIKELPGSIGQLDSLRGLHIEYNSIRTLPEEMFDVKRDTPCTIFSEGTPIRFLPVTEEKFKEGYKWFEKLNGVIYKDEVSPE
ncbi:leucine-rich repeat domain-containing protein [Marinigracilibium pacificum]|uniref:Leucine-rich repeat domain-containing protein n=1 Tax=Marinigracilibium pacificum TaxID=2729599 RepID=A0A848J5T8_9BACT|nr:leucine-rich repeat domain-containing protein [Marinigracilibium pacificum]NMM49834.1 leucine-rich repeat domain-containing protein [Marinigracilibium pacificum]